IKTRNERTLPLMPELVAVLRIQLRGRQAGPVFRRRRWRDTQSRLQYGTRDAIEAELDRRLAGFEEKVGQPLERGERLRVAQSIWRDLGALKEDRVRTEFLRLTTAIGLPACTAPKMLRHLFATALQEGRVDPLIRNELMGHVAVGERSAGH